MDENLTLQSGNPTDNKTFTQEEVNDLVSKRLSKSEKSFLTKLGLEKKEDIDGLIEKLKDYDLIKGKHSELEQEVNVLRGEKTKAQYIRAIEKQNVDDDLIEFVYSKVEPKKDEKVDDYKTRLEEYLANHTNYIKGNLQTIDTSINLSGKTTPVSPNKRMNDFIRKKG
jgi:hypothetical protein